MRKTGRAGSLFRLRDRGKGAQRLREEVGEERAEDVCFFGVCVVYDGGDFCLEVRERRHVWSVLAHFSESGGVALERVRACAFHWIGNKQKQKRVRVVRM